MQRWESETMKQSYWTGVAEYEASSRPAGEAKKKEQNGNAMVQQHWSMMGEEESDRF
jgi:hypothetical protein